MAKKLIFTIVLFVISILASTFVLATDNENTMMNNATNDVRDAVDGAENTIKNTVEDGKDTVKDITNDTHDAENNVMNNNSNYTANRTSTTRTTGTDNATFLGMNSTTWTWIVLAIATVAIVALVWYYSTRITNTSRYDDNN